MVAYECKKCKKIFKLKGDYTRHINRKIPCGDNNGDNIQNQLCNQIKNTNDVQVIQIDQDKSHTNNTINDIEIGEIITINGKYKCYFCPSMFDDVILLEKH